MHRSRLIALLLALPFALEGGACRKSAPEGESKSALESRAPAAGAIGSEHSHEIVYAASAHVRIVDTRTAAVSGGIDLKKAITSIAFTPDGSEAYVAASDGVYRVDAARQEVTGRVTVYPARHVELDETGTKLLILEHEVAVAPDGTRDPKPFRMVVADAASGIVTRTEEIGERVLYALPSLSARRHHVVITESGELRVGRPSEALKEGKTIDLLGGVPSKGPVRARAMVVTHAGKAYVPVEGEPSRILILDLEEGKVMAIDLKRALPIRGLAVLPDGKALVVNGVRELVVVDLVERRIRSKIDLAGAHQGIALSSDGRYAFLAQTIDGTGGAVASVRLDPPRLEQKIHLDDISPWVIAVRPRRAEAPSPRR